MFIDTGWNNNDYRESKIVPEWLKKLQGRYSSIKNTMKKKKSLKKKTFGT
jgi:hypothetical protein